MKRPRFSLKDQEKFVDIVYDKKEEGKSIRSAVREVGISIASFYRWEEAIKGKRYRSARYGETRLPTVDRAIDIITNYHDYEKMERLISILRLSFWMLWPDDPDSHEPAVVAGLLVYFSKDKKVSYLSDIESEYLDILLKHIRIDVILSFYDWSVNIGPQFEQLRQHSRRYSNRDAMAEVVRYFIITALKQNKFQEKPNLAKSKDALQAGILGSSIELSDRTFKEYWRRYASSAPFVYVDNYSAKLSWMLDPTSSSYIECVDEILSNPEDAKLFLSNCKFVTEIMKANLDGRALARIRYPAFPDGLIAEPVVPVQIEALRID